MSSATIQPHNLKAAANWNSGGMAYDRISETIADAIEHCVIRLAPQSGEYVLDIATGTGWAACRLAAQGAKVTGVDLDADLIDAAKIRAGEIGLTINFQVGDVEKLPFTDQSFDAVVSAFGIMFASNPEVAATELARVCKQGARAALIAWLPEDSIDGLFRVMKPYMTLPAVSPPSPFEWGDRQRVQQLLGKSFDLRFEIGTTVLRLPDGAAAWDLFVTGYGTTKSLAASLDNEKREKLRRDFIAYHESFTSELGIAMPRKYLLAVGTRK